MNRQTYTWISVLRPALISLKEDKCELCDRNCDKLHVHHLDGNPENNNRNNLMVLCMGCHKAIHNNSLKVLLKIKKEILSGKSCSQISRDMKLPELRIRRTKWRLFGKKK